MLLFPGHLQEVGLKIEQLTSDWQDASVTGNGFTCSAMIWSPVFFLMYPRTSENKKNFYNRGMPYLYRTLQIISVIGTCYLIFKASLALDESNFFLVPVFFLLKYAF